jgi:F-type H+-transporting ATPase subunit b
MQSLFNSLGIDWKLLLSQAANFALVLIILRLTVYKPLLELMRKRRERIEQGLEKADEADRRLTEIGELQKEKLKEAEHKGVQIIRGAEDEAKRERQKILDDAARAEADIIKRAQERTKADEAAALRKVEAQAVHLVKEILIRTVAVKPEAVDEALIEKVARSMQQPQ